MPTSTNVQNLKINELTEAQFDAAVQGGIIGENEISIITDADTTESLTVTLVAANWVNDSQTVTATGVSATNNVFVSPAPASASDYSDAGIICTAQGANSLTFECDTTPSNDITVNIAILA